MKASCLCGQKAFASESSAEAQYRRIWDRDVRGDEAKPTGVGRCRFGSWHLLFAPPACSLAAMSKKRIQENRERRELFQQRWPEGALCVVPWCDRWADDGHEPLTRARRGSITEPDNVVPTCRRHNSELTKEPAWGYALDLLIHSWDERSYAQQAADRVRKLADWETVLHVHDITFCPWERAYLPADHRCVAGSQPAPRRSTEPPAWSSCLSASAEDLTRHGSPSKVFDAPP